MARNSPTSWSARQHKACIVLLSLGLLGVSVTLVSWRTAPNAGAAGRVAQDGQPARRPDISFRQQVFRSQTISPGSGDGSSSSSSGANSTRGNSSWSGAAAADGFDMQGVNSVWSAVADMDAADAGDSSVSYLQPEPGQHGAEVVLPATPGTVAAAESGASSSSSQRGSNSSSSSSSQRGSSSSSQRGSSSSSSSSQRGSSSSNSSSSNSSSSSSDGGCGCWQVDPEQLSQVCSVSRIQFPEGVDDLITNCTHMLAHNEPRYMAYVPHGGTCGRQLLLHTFWAGPMTWKLRAVIQSFLFTHHSNDSSCAPKPVLNVWLASHDPTPELLQQWAREWEAPFFTCSDQLRFRHWTHNVWLDWLPDSFFRSLSVRMNKVLSVRNFTVTSDGLRRAVAATRAPDSKVGYSDAVRFLVLYAFGGIYTDGDVLLLRSLQPLQHLEFLYEWSFVRRRTNTAVFGLQQHSRFASAVIQAALSRSLARDNTTGRLHFDVRVFVSRFHPLIVMRRAPIKFRADLHLLPSLPFDPVWLALDAAAFNHTPNTHTQLHRVRAWADMFTEPPAHLVLPGSPREYFRGVWALHWHNQWQQPLVPGSMMGRWVGLFEAFLRGQEPNPHGLMYHVGEDCSHPEETPVVT